MELFFYNDTFDEMIQHYHLTKEQLQFTGSPSDAVELYKQDPNRHPILAIVDNTLVTFLVLYDTEGVSPSYNDPNTLIIRNFSTDTHYLGKGYARKALTLLPPFIQQHFPHVQQIILGVNTKNLPAQQLYQKFGFIDTGKRGTGEKGKLIIMQFPL